VEFCNEKLQDGYESFHKFMVSEGRIAIFKVPPVIGADFDDKLFGLRYLEWNDQWRVWWGRNASGSFFWIENGKVVCLKHTLIRAPEVMGKLQFTMKCKTQDFKNSGKTEQLGSENVDVFGSDWSLPRVVSSKVNGLCICVTCVPRKSIFAEYYLKILRAASNPFVDIMVQCGSELPFIPVLCSSFTLIVADEIWGYITTCLYDCILRKSRPESPPDLLTCFKECYPQFLETVSLMWESQDDNVKQEILCLTFEFVIRHRVTMWDKCKEELDLDYDQSGLFFLGMRTNLGHSMGKWVPYFKLNQPYWQTPPYWLLDNPNQLENLQNKLHRFTMNLVDEEVVPTPTNYGNLDAPGLPQIHWTDHVEGFMIYKDEIEALQDWNIAKLKLPLYYQAHYFQRNDSRFLEMILSLPFERLRHFPRLRSLQELHLFVEKKLPKAWTALHSFTSECLENPQKFDVLKGFQEKSLHSFQRQPRDVKIKMFINTNSAFLDQCAGILTSFIPIVDHIKAKDLSRICRNLMMQSKIWTDEGTRESLSSWFAISAFHFLFSHPNLHQLMRSCATPAPVTPLRAETR